MDLTQVKQTYELLYCVQYITTVFDRPLQQEIFSSNGQQYHQFQLSEQSRLT